MAAIAPTRRARAAAAVAVGVLVAAWLVLDARLNPTGVGDVDQGWASARVVLAGQDPYTAIGPGHAFPWRWPYFYPLSAALPHLSLAWLAVVPARIAFMAVSSALLAFTLTVVEWSGLWVLMSGAFLFAISTKQYAPLLTAAFLAPGALGWAFAIKPNIGAALWAAQPTRHRQLAGATWVAAMLAAGFAILPGWPASWLSAVRTAHHFTPPLLAPGGVLVLASLLRWRQPEARLLLALACVPQTPLLYETLPLGLVARTRIERYLFGILTLVVWAILAVWGRAGGGGPVVADAYWYAWATLSGRLIVWLVYLPCLVMVLRRPNDGAVPDWLERAVAAVRARVVGRSVPRAEGSAR